jgi:hypothetical protein
MVMLVFNSYQMGVTLDGGLKYPLFFLKNYCFSTLCKLILIIPISIADQKLV